MSAALALALLAVQADGPPPGDGPRGTSGEAARYDEVGHATQFDYELMKAGKRGDETFVRARHPTLPVGSTVEVTELRTGKTVLVLIAEQGPVPNAIIALSNQAERLLKMEDRPFGGVRVRLVTPTPQDLGALRAGRGASPRLDAPRSLLHGLAMRLDPLPPFRNPGVPMPPAVPQQPSTSPVDTPVKGESRVSERRSVASATTLKPPAMKPIAAMKPTASPHPIAPATRGLFVQIAAVSDKARADALAGTLHGTVQPTGKAYRVRLGPFADPAAAKRARDGAAAHGYADARVVRED